MSAPAPIALPDCGPLGPSAAAQLKSVVLVGAGVIGAAAAGLLARVPQIDRVVVIDHDVYEPANRAQDIMPDDIGQPKAMVQAARLRRINPALQAVPIVEAVEHVPLGVLRAPVLLCAVDSRASRVYLNGACARVGTPWIDAGVQAEGRLARVNVYIPGVDNPCLECAFDERDYRMLEQRYPCDPHPGLVPATRAPACLGALAAALQVNECEMLLAGRLAQALIGRQVLVDAAWHKHYVTTFRRNPACRFDHTTWQVELLDRGPAALSIGDALAFAAGSGGSASAFGVEGQTFVRCLSCPGCGEARPLFWRLSGRLRDDEYCPHCRSRMRATGCDVTPWLSEHHLPAGASMEPLTTFGLRAGDIITVRSDQGSRHVQLGLPEWRCQPEPSPPAVAPAAVGAAEGVSP